MMTMNIYLTVDVSMFSNPVTEQVRQGDKKNP